MQFQLDKTPDEKRISDEQSEQINRLTKDK